MIKKVITKKERLVWLVIVLTPFISTDLIMEYFLDNWHPFHLPEWLIVAVIYFTISTVVFTIMNHLFLKKLQNKK